jgi:hypothetical protein
MTRYVIADARDVLQDRETIDLDDGHHHVTIKDGTITAVPMAEQCRSCGCDEEHHEDRKCWVCNEFCIYRPAWVDTEETP